jgi:hypothetical protein
MKGLIQQQPYVQDPENYSDLMVCQSTAGYYIGTMYKDPELGGQLVPGTRDTGYYQTRAAAEAALAALEAGSSDAPALRTHP